MAPINMGIDLRVPVRPTPMSLKKLLRRGRFIEVTPMIDKFPITKTTKATVLYVVHFRSSVAWSEIVERARLDSLQPALLDHLLALCRSEPDMDFDEPLACLGSYWKTGDHTGTIFAPYVRNASRPSAKLKRHLHIHSNRKRFGPEWRFAMVPRPLRYH